MKRFFGVIFLISVLSGAWVWADDVSNPPAKSESAGIADSAELPNYGGTPEEYVPFGHFTKPYKRFFLEPLLYRGYGRHIPEPKHVESVKIGFIGPIMKTVSVATGGASHEEPLGLKMLQGARLAIEHANANGGYRGSGIPYELVVKNDNGLWGASGSEIIDLAYKDKVWAIVGTIDGANSHIAIRVALKIEIPMMNTGDTDPTFIETNIPWVFRNITDDRTMCYLLADFAFKKLGLTKIAALRAGNRYGRMSIDEFRDGARRLGFPFATEMQYRLGDTDYTTQLKRIQDLKPDAVITYGNSYESALVLKQMREMGMDQWYFGSDRMVTQEFLDIVGDKAGKVAAGYPYNPTSKDDRHVQFIEAFKERFGAEPETYAGHAYDGIEMLVQAIEEAGLNRALIRDTLAEMTNFHGVTGIKEMDAVFSNRSSACLAIVEDGEFKFYTRDQILGEDSLEFTKR